MRPTPARGGVRPRSYPPGLLFGQLPSFGGVGLGLGILGAMAGAIIIRSMVYGISPLSPLHLGMAGGIMLLVVLAATLMPVRKASGVDPLEALRID